MHAREVHAHETSAIRCTLVGCMPVRYVLIFENSFVGFTLDAEPGLAGYGERTLELTESTIPSATARFQKTPLAGIESARSGDSIAAKNTKFRAETRKLGF